MPLEVLLFIVVVFLLGVGVTLGVQWVIKDGRALTEMKANTKRTHRSWCKTEPCSTPEYHR